MTYKIVLDSDFSAYSTDIEYEIPLVQEKDDGRNREFTTISNQDPEAARHFGFQPGQSNPTLQFTMYNNDTDRSNGTFNDAGLGFDTRFSSFDVKTVQEQIIWLTEYIADNSSDPRWTLFGGRFSDPDGDGTEEGTRVVIKRANHRRLAGLNAARATLELKLGVTI